MKINHSITIIAFLFVFVNSVFSQTTKKTIKGSNILKTDERTVGDFRSIKVSMGVNVYLKQGTNKNIRIEAEDNIIPYIITDVKDNTLEITFDMANSYPDIKPVKVYVEAENLENIEATVGGNVVIEGIWKQEKLHGSISTGSNLHGALELKELDLEVNSGSNAYLSGQVDKALLNIESGSILKAKDLKIENATLKATGASNASINAAKEISVIASGASKVDYYGRPVVLAKEVSDVSKVKNKK